MNAKTATERNAEFRERMKRQGLKQISNLFAHPDDFQRIRNYVAKLNAKRQKP